MPPTDRAADTFDPELICALHSAVDLGLDRPPICSGCRGKTRHPCDVIRLLDALEVERARRERVEAVAAFARHTDYCRRRIIASLGCPCGLSAAVDALTNLAGERPAADGRVEE